MGIRSKCFFPIRRGVTSDSIGPKRARRCHVRFTISYSPSHDASGCSYRWGSHKGQLIEGPPVLLLGCNKCVRITIGGVGWSVVNFIPQPIPLIRAGISGSLHSGIVRNMECNTSYATAITIEHKINAAIIILRNVLKKLAELPESAGLKALARPEALLCIGQMLLKGIPPSHSTWIRRRCLHPA